MIVLAVDPGIKNLGFAVVKDGKLVQYGVYNTVNKVNKKYHKNYSYLVKRFTRFKFWKQADVIIVERQMNQKMRCVSTALICFAWPRGILVSPRSVKIHHGISMGDYRKNKAMAVQRAPLYMSEGSRRRFQLLKHKRDDISDAILMAFYHYETLGKEKACPSVVMSDDELSDSDIEINLMDEVQELKYKDTPLFTGPDVIELNKN